MIIPNQFKLVVSCHIWWVNQRSKDQSPLVWYKSEHTVFGAGADSEGCRPRRASKTEDEVVSHCFHSMLHVSYCVSMSKLRGTSARFLVLLHAFADEV